MSKLGYLSNAILSLIPWGLGLMAGHSGSGFAYWVTAAIVVGGATLVLYTVVGKATGANDG